MSHLFKPVHHRLSANSRSFIIEPVMSFGIDDDGWHASGIYQIHDEQSIIGRFYFEGKQWQYQGLGLSDIEQEELAYFIRFYDGEAA